MGSHYIPVGKIKIDKEILDIACPAAGYSETPPDPAIYCPANGYNQPDEVWEPPVNIIDPESEQILLLCDDLNQGLIGLRAAITVGKVKIEVLSTDMVVLSSNTYTSNSTVQVNFPTQGTGTFYVVRITPENVGEYITSFNRYSITGFILQAYRILEAKFYTPNMLTLNDSFRDLMYFSACTFHTDMNSLVDLRYTFAGTNIFSVDFPSMESLDRFEYVFLNCSNYTKLVLDKSYPNLRLLTYLGQNSGIKEVSITGSLPSLESLNYAFESMYFLKKVSQFTYLPLLASVASIFRNTPSLNLDEYVFPELPSLTGSNTYILYNSAIRKLVFTGESPLFLEGKYMLDGASKLEEFVFPETIKGETPTALGTDWQYWNRNTHSMRKLVLPLTMADFNPNNYWRTWYAIEEITTCNNWGNRNHNINISVATLKTFWQPNLKVSGLTLGYSSTIPCQLTQVEVDWANSDYSTGQITIRAQLGATEIDRIFTALPTLAGKTIDVKNNPGFATCDPSIAQAKGWTVTGA